MKEEQQLIYEILIGQIDRFGYVINTFQDDLYSISFKLLRDEEKAKSIVKHCFQHIYEHLPDYKEGGDFSQWLYTIAIPFLFDRMEITLGQPEHEFYDLPFPVQKVMLLHYILRMDSEQIASIINISLADVENYLEEGKNVLSRKVQTLLAGKDCPSTEKLFAFYNKELSADEVDSISEHIEFCPSCREQLESLEKEEQQLIAFFQSTYLPESFSEEVIATLTPYTKKEKGSKSWQYQLVTTVTLLTVILLGFFVFPKLAPVYTMVSNYIKYGEIYNVWDEGTYTVTDNDLTLEITSMELSPKHILLNYKVTYDDDLAFDRNKHFVEMLHNTVSLQNGDEIMELQMAIPVSFPDELNNEGLIYIWLNELNEIPDKFELLLNVKRFGYKVGEWELEIPVTYAKAKLQTEVIAIDESFTIGEDFHFRLEQFERANLASSLTMFLELSEDELLEKREMIEQNENWDMWDTYYGIFPYLDLQLVTENGEILAGFNMYSTPEIMDDGIRIKYEFLHLLINPHTYELNSLLEKNVPLYFQLNGASIREPVELEIPIKLEEGTYPVNHSLNGYHIQEVKVIEKELDYTEESNFFIHLIGEKDESYVYNVWWEVIDEEGNRMEDIGLGQNSGFDALYDDPTILQKMEVWSHAEKLPESFKIRTSDASKYFQPEEPIRYLIFDPDRE